MPVLHRIAIRKLNLSNKHKVYMQQTAAAAACNKNSIIVETLKIAHTHLIIGLINVTAISISSASSCSSMPHRSALRPLVALKTVIAHTCIYQLPHTHLTHTHTSARTQTITK